MAKLKPQKTLADYVGIAISPLLIMVLVGSLAFFLLEVIQVSPHSGSLRWTMFWYVIAIVLIARIGIEQGKAHAMGYGLAIAMATSLVILRYAGQHFLYCVPIMGLIWWCANKLTWDCTLIDDSDDASGEGLLQVAGIDQKDQPKTESTHEESRPEPQQELPQRDAAGLSLEEQLRADRERRDSLWAENTQTKKKSKVHSPGLWIIYFSLAALPMFGLGQLLIPANETARRATAFQYLWFYVAAALALLLTTSFLGLRRYLRQRRMVMPPLVVKHWLGMGGVMILVIMFVALLLPRPNAAYSITGMIDDLGGKIQKATDHAFPKDDAGESDTKKQGKGKARKEIKKKSGNKRSRGKQSQKAKGGNKKDGKQSKQKSQQKGNQKGQKGKNKKQSSAANKKENNQKGKAGKKQQSKKSEGGKKKDQTQKGENKNQQGKIKKQGDEQRKAERKEKNEQNKKQKTDNRANKGEQNEDNQAQKKKENGENRDEEELRDEQKRQDEELNQEEQNEEEEREANDRNQEQEEEKQPQEEQPEQSQSKPWNFNIADWVGDIFKWILYAIIAIVLLYYLIKNWAEVVAFFRNLWQELMNLFHRSPPEREDEVQAESVFVEVPPPFSSFRDPFLTGAASNMSPSEVVIYTFDALDSWAYENAEARQKDETPVEFASSLENRSPSEMWQKFAKLYTRTVYSEKKPNEQCYDLLRNVWQEMAVRQTSHSHPMEV